MPSVVARMNQQTTLLGVFGRRMKEELLTIYQEFITDTSSETTADIENRVIDSVVSIPLMNTKATFLKDGSYNACRVVAYPIARQRAFAIAIEEMQTHHATENARITKGNSIRIQSAIEVLELELKKIPLNTMSAKLLSPRYMSPGCLLTIQSDGNSTPLLALTT